MSFQIAMAYPNNIIHVHRLSRHIGNDEDLQKIFDLLAIIKSNVILNKSSVIGNLDFYNNYIIGKDSAGYETICHMINILNGKKNKVRIL